MIEPLDLSQTLDALEGSWPTEPAYPSHLARRCHELHKTPLAQFTVEDLRIMIGQGIGLRFLVPLALEQLRRDPLAQGDFYPGDLLGSLLGVSHSFWHDSPALRAQVADIVSRVSQVPEELADAVNKFRGQEL